MEQVGVLVIGAGAVGLAVGRALAEKFEDVVVVEQEDSFGRHTSSRNSEVIHSGIYYPQNTLKRSMCVHGNRLMYEFLARYRVNHKNTGKLVVATAEAELSALHRLYENGLANEVPGLKLLSRDETLRMEPQVKAIESLWVPSTGIMDTHNLMKRLESLIEDNDGFVVYDMKVTGLDQKDGGWEVHFANGEVYHSEIVINCSGIFSGDILPLVGMQDRSDLKLHWCRGEYFRCTKVKGINHLIYPLPDPLGVSLGIHLVLDLNGEIRFGPSAEYTDSINYSMDESHKSAFYQSVNNYLPVEEDWLSPDDVGIRPKLQAPGQPVRDFYIKHEENLPGFINLVGIDSPGLTSCLAISEYVRKMVEEILG